MADAIIWPNISRHFWSCTNKQLMSFLAGILAISNVFEGKLKNRKLFEGEEAHQSVQISYTFIYSM